MRGSGYRPTKRCAISSVTASPNYSHSLFQQLTWPEDLHTDLEQLEQLVNGDINTYTLEKRYYTRNGEVVWALLAVSVVRHTGRLAALFYRPD